MSTYLLDPTPSNTLSTACSVRMESVIQVDCTRYTRHEFYSPLDHFAVHHEHSSASLTATPDWRLQLLSHRPLGGIEMVQSQANWTQLSWLQSAVHYQNRTVDWIVRCRDIPGSTPDKLLHNIEKQSFFYNWTETVCVFWSVFLHLLYLLPCFLPFGQWNLRPTPLGRLQLHVFVSLVSNW